MNVIYNAVFVTLYIQQVTSLQSELEVKKNQLQTREEEWADVQAEKEELETSLIELDTQHQEAMDQLIQIRNGLAQQLELVKGQLKDAEDVLSQMKEQTVEIHQQMEKQKRDITTLQKELDQEKEQKKISPKSLTIQESDDEINEKDNLIQSLQEELARLKSSGKFDLSQDLSQDGKDELIQLVMETRSQLQEKEDAVHRLEEEVEDNEAQTQEKDRQIHNLQQQLASLREWNDQTEEEADLSELRDKNGALEQELKHCKQSLSDLQVLSDKQDSELNDLKQKLQGGAIAINDLHMDIKELEDSLKQGEKSIAEKVDKIKDLRTLNEQLKSKINELESKSETLGKTNEELQQTVAAQSSNKETEIQQTSEQLSAVELEKCRNLLSESDQNNVELVQQIDSLTVNLTDIQKSNSQLIGKLTESEKCCNKIKENSEKHIKQLETDLELVHSEKKCINENFAQLQTQIKHLENYVNELKQELDASSLKEKDQDLTNNQYDKDTLISKLEDSIKQLSNDNKTLQTSCDERDSSINILQDEVRDLKEEAESLRQSVDKSMASETQLSDLLSEREQEVSQTKHINIEIHNQLELYKQQLDDHHAVLDSLTTLKQQANLLKEENQNLKQKLSSFASMGVTEAREDIEAAGLDSELTSAPERIVDNSINTQQSDHVAEQEEHISKYKSMMSSYDEDIVKLNQRIEDQARALQDQDKEMINQNEQIMRFQQSSKETEMEINNLRKQLQEKTISTDKQQVSKSSENEEVFEDVIEKSIDSVTSVMQNGRLDSIGSNKENESGVIEEMEHLQSLIQEKDKVIKELQGNNSSLLRMLDSKGGKSNFLDINRLEGEVHALKLEREQIMAVMNEKSRECSSLKSEVHRLMNIISSEKVALQKLQVGEHRLLTKMGFICIRCSIYRGILRKQARHFFIYLDIVLLHTDSMFSSLYNCMFSSLYNCVTSS